MKKCTKCGINKRFSDFYKRSNTKCGLQSICKSCKKILYKASADKYYTENKHKINSQRATYQRLRRAVDPNFRLLQNLRAGISRTILRNQKVSATLELVGCSLDELRAHLKKQFTRDMSWDNYGEWHIDHIRPCSSFDLTKASEQKKCFNYRNLQPLWAKDNLIKGAKYDY